VGSRLGLADRIGAALVRPARALADSDAGHGGGAHDALLLLLLKLVCLDTPALVAAGWTGLLVGPREAVQMLVARLSAVIGLDVACIFAGGVLVTILAGRRRAVGRDLDLGAVAFVPLLAVEVVAGLVAVVLGLRLSALGGYLVLGAGGLWMATLLGLAVRQARLRVVQP
jgi:hypothetical protein